MPRNTDLQKVVVIGAGPAVIGQGAEYDAAVLQVCRVLKEEGCTAIVVDSNPAALSTDSGVADRVYLTPLISESLCQIVGKEQPDLLLAGFGGQTAFNLLAQMKAEPRLETFPRLDVAWRAMSQTQNREEFRELLAGLGWQPVPGQIVRSVTEGMTAGRSLGFPLVVRGSFSMGGGGAALVYNQEELEAALGQALGSASAGPVVVEKALADFEAVTLELIRDREGRTLEVALAEHIEPVGVHGGNSPVRFLPRTAMPSWVQPLMERIGPLLETVEATGALQIKLARNPASGVVYCLDLNPRFTFNAMVASEISDYPLAALSVKIALGYTVEEALADVTSGEKLWSPLTFVKLPRFDFQRFPGADPELGPSVKATGAVLGLGDGPQAALEKAIRAIGKGWDGWEAGRTAGEMTLTALKVKLAVAHETRLFYLHDAFKMGLTTDEIRELTGLNRRFLEELKELIGLEKELSTYALYNLPGPVLLKAKEYGFSDRQLAETLRVDETEIRAARERLGIYPVRRVAATRSEGGEWCGIGYDDQPVEAETPQKPGVILVAATPDMIEGGSADDWNVIHGARGLKECGYRVILVAANPVTAALATGDVERVYLEPPTVETILNIGQLEMADSVLLQFGGAAALALAEPLARLGMRIEGTAAEDLAELDQPERFKNLIHRLQIAAPHQYPAKGAIEVSEALARLGFPVVIRTGYRPGGSVTRAIYHSFQLGQLVEALDREALWPVTVAKLLDDAVGVMVDGIGNGKAFMVAGIAEQIETADIDPADSAFSAPPYSLDGELLERIRHLSGEIFKALALKGIISLRWAVKHDQIYLLEARPWAGESLAVLSKTGGTDWAAAAARAALGGRLPQQTAAGERFRHTAVKEAVFSFNRFPGVDTVLGPEKRSSGMVLGMDSDFGMAFIQAQLGAGEKIPRSGQIYLSIRNEDKRAFITIAKQLLDFGFKLAAPEETAAILERNNIACERVRRPGEGRPDILDLIKNGEIQWIINTPSEAPGRSNEGVIRSIAVLRGIPVITTLSGALAAVNGLKKYLTSGLTVKALDD